MIIHKCDKCGTKVEQLKGQHSQTPADWIELGLRYQQTIYEICDKCKKDLGIDAEHPKESAGEKLIDIIAEIVEEVVEDYK